MKILILGALLSFFPQSAPAATGAGDYKVDELTLKSRPVVSLVREGNPANAGPDITAAVTELHKVVAEKKLKADGRPYIRTLEISKDKWKYEVGLPMASKVSIPMESGIKAGTLPGGKVARTVHKGSPEGFKNAFAALNDYLEKKKITKAGPHWMVHRNDLSMVKSPEEFETEIIYPIKK